jgi:hypothetical protein
MPARPLGGILEERDARRCAMPEPDEPAYTIVEERLVDADTQPAWIVTWKSIGDESEIRRRMSDEEYNASVAGPRDEKPLWKRAQIDPIGTPDAE